MDNDIYWFDILALSNKDKQKLHLTSNEIALTLDDIQLITESTKVDMQELRNMVNKVGFTNFEIPNEIGISKAMFTMAFTETSKNKRGLRMKTVVAILNAIRRRNIMDPFDKILVKGDKKE